jgi:hypothetical protein
VDAEAGGGRHVDTSIGRRGAGGQGGGSAFHHREELPAPLDALQRLRSAVLEGDVGADDQVPDGPGSEDLPSLGADLGFIPVIVADACGSVDAAAGERSLASLDYAMMSLATDVDTITRLLEPAS